MTDIPDWVPKGVARIAAVLSFGPEVQQRLLTDERMRWVWATLGEHEDIRNDVQEIIPAPSSVDDFYARYPDARLIRLEPDGGEDKPDGARTRLRRARTRLTRATKLPLAIVATTCRRSSLLLARLMTFMRAILMRGSSDWSPTGAKSDGGEDRPDEGEDRPDGGEDKPDGGEDKPDGGRTNLRRARTALRRARPALTRASTALKKASSSLPSTCWTPFTRTCDFHGCVTSGCRKFRFH